jgi:hypothetical protein
MAWAQFLKTPNNKTVLSPSAGTAIPLALDASPKPRRYARSD